MHENYAADHARARCVERDLLTLTIALLAVFLGPVAGNTQTPTPTPTPTPGACSLATLPDNTPVECVTGAEAPPSLLGVSGGNYNSVALTVTKTQTTVTCCTGTFGALVKDSGSNHYVLSSNHTLARNSSTGRAAKGNEAIVQPGLVDLGCWQDPTDTVAKLSKWTPIDFKGNQNQLDAAIAKVVNANRGPGGPLVPGVDPGGNILNLGQISTTPFPFDSLIDGLAVMKMGRTSCLTTGRIDAFDAMGIVTYPATCNVAASGNALFDHQVLVVGEALGSSSGSACAFAAAGDSGALVVTYDFECPQGIGLVFAAASGSPVDGGGQIVAVNPIANILTKFNVSLVGKQCTPSGLAQQIDASTAAAGITAQLRASIEQVRIVKEAAARTLLHHREVVAVGIGTGDDPDTAVLNVYLQEDTPRIRNEVLSRLGNTRVRFKHAGRFRAL